MRGRFHGRGNLSIMGFFCEEFFWEINYSQEFLGPESYNNRWKWKTAKCRLVIHKVTTFLTPDKRSLRKHNVDHYVHLCMLYASPHWLTHTTIIMYTCLKFAFWNLLLKYKLGIGRHGRGLSMPTKQHELSTTGSCACVHAESLQLGPTLCESMCCSLLASAVHGTLQARIPEWVAMPFSRGSSQPRDWTGISCGSCLAGGLFNHWATGEASLLLVGAILLPREH